MNRYIPFRKNDSFKNWLNKNCIQCSEYETKSKSISEANCKAGFDMYIGSVLGVIRYQTVVFVGYHEFRNESVMLRTDCKQFKKK